MKVLSSRFINPIVMQPNDTVEFAMMMEDEQVYKHRHIATKKQTINYVKILKYNQFQGVKDCFVWVIGYREPEKGSK